MLVAAVSAARAARSCQGGARPMDATRGFEDVLETDYLVIGAGASGMAFADTLLDHSAHDIILLDRRHAPGGHWLDAYPFVRLHMPSALYGVNSTPLGQDRIDGAGLNAGYCERATGVEVCAYYEQVLRERMLPGGRLRFLALHDHQGAESAEDNVHLARCRLTGRTRRIHARRALVDARYLGPAIPARRPPPFAVAPGMRVITPNALPDVTDAPGGFTVIGAGKTAADCVIWLLEHGVEPGAIRWIRPRDPWLIDRSCLQALELAVSTIVCAARTTEAVAAARDMDDLFARLQAAGLLVALDPAVTPGTYRGALTSAAERALLRRVTDVVRAGRVSAITRERIEMQAGSVPTDASQVHIDCTAGALSLKPAVPVFAPGRITLQSLRFGLTCFNAAVTAFVEATRQDLAEKNRLCTPVAMPETGQDWARTWLSGVMADAAWNAEPDIKAFLHASRLNIPRGLQGRQDDPELGAAMASLMQHRADAVANMRRLLGAA